MKAEDCKPGVRVVHIPTGAVGVIDEYRPYEGKILMYFRGDRIEGKREEVLLAELEIAGSPEAMARIRERAESVAHEVKVGAHGTRSWDQLQDMIPDGPTPEEMEWAPGMRVLHKPTQAVAVIDSVNLTDGTLFIKFTNGVHDDVPIADVEKIADAKPKADRAKEVMGDLIEGFAKLTGQAGASLLTISVINELIGVRKSLARLADVGELIAVLQAQQCVPDHIAAKLDPWRNDLLKSMSKRAERRLKRSERVTKKKRKPYSPPTVTKQVPTQETTV